MVQSEEEVKESRKQAELPPDMLSEQEHGPERMLEGVAVAPGIAIGPVYHYARNSFDDVEHREIGEDEVKEELHRFEKAVLRSERDLNKIASIAREKIGEQSAEIFEAQLLMLRDQSVYDTVVDYVQNRHTGADYAVQKTMTKHRRHMEAAETKYLRERASDLLDVQERIIRHLRRGKAVWKVDPNTIVVAEDLNATDMLLFSRRHLLGCAMDYGGATSHVSIMARSLGVPTVVGMHRISKEVTQGQTIILDGVTGRVIIDPRPATLEKYRARQERYRELQEKRKELVPLPAETLDGHRVALRANLEFEEELSLLDEYGADGVGLFRTEMPFLMQRRVSFDESEQFDAYRRIVRAVSPSVTTFRVIDVGGDKMLPMARREHNPMLGWRGLRILLEKPELLKTQLRAILSAGAEGPIRLLLPMVTNLEEIEQFRRVLQEVQMALEGEQIGNPHQLEVGIMVEVPSVALMADRFAQEVDFFSIGSNDLTQYVLAVDRGNDLVADKYDELHPAVLILIDKVVRAGRRHDIPVSICGQMAGNPRIAPILIGLQLSELSASPTYLPDLKRVLRAIEYSEARQLAQEALQAESVQQVHALLDDWLHQHIAFDEVFLEQE